MFYLFNIWQTSTVHFWMMLSCTVEKGKPWSDLQSVNHISQQCEKLIKKIQIFSFFMHIDTKMSASFLNGSLWRFYVGSLQWRSQSFILTDSNFPPLTCSNKECFRKKKVVVLGDITHHSAKCFCISLVLFYHNFKSLLFLDLGTNTVSLK